MARFALALASVVASVLAAGGCHSHWTAEVTQPALVLESTKEARTSLPLSIVMHDMELPRFIRLANTAYYVAVSRDRFRFHVSLAAKFESMCDLNTWDAWVEDARGTRYSPENLDQRHVRPITFGPLTFYRGAADFTIYRRDLIQSGEHVTLVLRRPGYEYRYVWSSPTEPEPEDS